MTVAPLQAAFFAGEAFSCHITFKNLHPAPTPTVAPSPTHLSPHNAISNLKRGHKSALSLTTPAATHGLTSSPTSYDREDYAGSSKLRTPLTASFAASSQGANQYKPTRRGLIGKQPINTTPASVKQARRTSSTAGDIVTSPVHEDAPSTSRGLYNTKRLPSVSHKRNNYSIAGQAGISSPDLPDLSAQQVALSYLQQQQHRSDLSQRSLSTRSVSSSKASGQTCRCYFCVASLIGRHRSALPVNFSVQYRLNINVRLSTHSAEVFHSTAERGRFVFLWHTRRADRCRTDTSQQHRFLRSWPKRLNGFRLTRHCIRLGISATKDKTSILFTNLPKHFYAHAFIRYGLAISGFS